jgi:transcriptional regulator with XRE-family HTH domain
MIDKISLRIKDIRKVLKISQSEMANKIGVHVQTLSKHERGEQIPSFETLASIVDRLGINPVWLLAGHGKIFKAPEDHMKTEELKSTLERIKEALNLKDNKELANELNIPTDDLIYTLIDLPSSSIVSLCKKYALNLNWVFFGEGPMYRADATAHYYIMGYKGLDASDLKKIERIYNEGNKAKLDAIRNLLNALDPREKSTQKRKSIK